MGTRTHYTPGTPSWCDLTTADQDGAKRFYGALFGWDFEDSPAGEGVVYSMGKLDGQYVAAISPQPQQQRDAGVPAMWNTYITVEDAGATLSRARELGAAVHADAFDVFDAGRMGVIQDPQRVYFEVWQPNRHIGAGIVNAPGAFSWSELVTSEVEGAERFYGELFGWKATSFEGLPIPYSTLAAADGRTIGGMRPAMDGEPSYWLVYFGCEEIEATVARVSELGGRQLSPPVDIGVGQLATVTDPEGAVFALYSGQFED